jgi:hypothetical protein
MHFFRIKIKHRNQRRPSLNTDQTNSSPISGRRTRVPSPAIPQPQFKSSIWQNLPFIGKVSQKDKQRIFVDVFILFFFDFKSKNNKWNIIFRSSSIFFEYG